ncbi:unnamed protein product, partial [Laminaria digitata]
VAHLDLTLHTFLDSHEPRRILSISLGSHEPISVVRATPWFDNHHARSEQKLGLVRRSRRLFRYGRQSRPLRCSSWVQTPRP